MPNWVYNGLTVEGSESSVLKLKEQVGKPISVPVIDWQTNELKIETNDNPIFSYWNIIAPTDLDAYPKQTDHTLDKPYAGDDWYSWNQRNWGVKWDASNCKSKELSDFNTIVFSFDTPWGTPEHFVRRLSKKYPNATFEMVSGSIENDSHYEFTCEDGKFEETCSYDSFKEAVEDGKWGGWDEWSELLEESEEV